MMIVPTFCLATLMLAAVTFTGETSHPSNSFYAAGSKVEATFALSGLAAGERRELSVSVVDERDRELDARTVPAVADGQGNWSGTLELPSARMGFYRVRAKAGDVPLAKRGTCPKGTMTYAVVPDPAKRPRLSEEDSFFGIFGNPFGAADLRPWLGTHHEIGGCKPGQPARAFPVYGAVLASRLKTDVAPYLSDPEERKRLPVWPWDLVDTPEGEALYRKALQSLARAVREKPSPDWSGPRIYEIFWEPDLTMKNPEHLVKVARIAREAIRSVDPDGLVAAPTFAGAGSDLMLRRCLDAGLAEQMDVFSIHPYTAYPPDGVNFAGKLRVMRELVRQAKGRDIPMIATESGGFCPGIPARELVQLDGQVVAHLTTLGEGFLFHNAFHGFDYGNDNNTDLDGDYGLTYNLQMPKNRWQPTQVSPRPCAAGLAAASWLLDGKRPTCTIEWLSPSVRGYAYADRRDNCTIALWDWTGSNTTVRLPVGRETVEVADVMGNVSRMKTEKGELALTLSTSPQYVLAPDPAVWGRAAQKRLNWSARKAPKAKDSSPIGIGKISPVWTNGGFALRVELENRSEGDLSGIIEASVADAAAERPFAAGAGTLKNLDIPVRVLMDDPFAARPVEVRVRIGDRTVTSRRLQMNFLVATQVQTGGKDPFAVWNPSVRFPMTMPVKRRPEFHHGPQDLSASAAFGWTGTHLLLDLIVDDDALDQTRDGWMTWAGDSVQVAFARTALEKESGNAYADVMEEAKTETTFAFTKRGPEAYRTVTWNWKGLPTGTHGEGLISRGTTPYDVTVEKLADGRSRLHYRIAFPWEWMRIENPAPGMSLRFAISVNDKDPDANTISAIEAFNLKVPRQFGYLVLGPRTGNVRDFGAKGDGVTLDTAAIQAAVDDVAAAGGGEVVVPRGRYRTGSIYLKSNVDFNVTEGAVVEASRDPADYNPWDVCPQNWRSEAENTSGGHLFLSIMQTNVTLRGCGRIEGSGLYFRTNAYDEARIAAARAKDRTGMGLSNLQAALSWRPGQMLYFVESDGVRLEGLTVRDAPYWSVFLHGCTHVLVSGLNITTRREHPLVYNGDGLAVDCCRHVVVEDCDIRTSDDALTLRASGRRLLHAPPECSDIRVRNCRLSSLQDAIRIGVGEGTVRDVDISGIVISDTRTGINFSSTWFPSAGVSFFNVRIADVTADCSDFLRLHRLRARDSDVDGILFEDIAARARNPSRIWARKGRPFRNVVFRNVRMNQPLEAVNVDGLSIDGGDLRLVEHTSEELVRLNDDIESFRKVLW